MSMKQTEIERLQAELAEAVAARTELSERLEVEAARVVNLQRHIEDLQGTVRPVGDPLTDRIVRMVGELGEVGPTRLAELLALDDPSLNKDSVRSLLGQLVTAGRLQKLGRGRYAPAG